MRFLFPLLVVCATRAALIRFDRLARMGVPCFGKLGHASRGGGGLEWWTGLVAVGGGRDGGVVALEAGWEEGIAGLGETVR